MKFAKLWLTLGQMRGQFHERNKSYKQYSVYLVKISMRFSIQHPWRGHSAEHGSDHGIGHHEGIMWETQGQADPWSKRADLRGGCGHWGGDLPLAVSMGRRRCPVAEFRLLDWSEHFLHFLQFKSSGLGQVQRPVLIHGRRCGCPARPAVGGGGCGGTPLPEAGWGLRSRGAVLVVG